MLFEQSIIRTVSEGGRPAPCFLRWAANACVAILFSSRRNCLAAAAPKSSTTLPIKQVHHATMSGCMLYSPARDDSMIVSYWLPIHSGSLSGRERGWSSPTPFLPSNRSSCYPSAQGQGLRACCNTPRFQRDLLEFRAAGSTCGMHAGPHYSRELLA